MDLLHPIALLFYGAAAGAIIAWLAATARANGKSSPVLIENQTQLARLREHADNKENELAQREARILRLEEMLSQAETDLSRVSQEHSAALARLEQLPGLRLCVEEKNSEIKEISGSLAHLKEKQTVLETILEKERAFMAEKLQLLESAKEQLTHAFEAVSARTLKNNQESFLELAKTAFAKDHEAARLDLEKRQEAVSRMVQPIRETLEKYDKQVLDMERMREKAYGSLSQQVQALAATQQQLHKETAELVKALRAPQVRGRWGEITLKRVVELAGMVNYCDFVEQESRSTENGRLRPDMIVRLPNHRQIVVDSKVPLLAFLEALEAKTEKERCEKLLVHAKQVQAHMNNLSQKSYWEQFQPSPEFVVLFIPGESFFSSALEQNPGLIEEGVDKGVILATPTTLISLLKAVAFGWRQETMAENAQRISALGTALYERIGTMATHLDNLGAQIQRCATVFNQTVGSFERRVLVAARRFHDLGIDNKGNDIQYIDPVEQGVQKVVPLEPEAPGHEETKQP